MKTLWSVARLELILLMRSRVLWVIVCVMAFFGVWEATGIRQLPWGMWDSWVTVSLFLVTLILLFTIGERIHRDQESHVDRIIWSTPVSTSTYLWGKYLSMLVVALGLTLVYALVAILADQFFNVPFQLPILGKVVYPSLGPEAYVIFWAWFVFVPTVFGVALVFSIITMSRGQRIIAYAGALLFWFASMFNALPGLLDITAGGFMSDAQGSHVFAIFQLAAQAGPNPSPLVVKQVMSLLHADIPPTFLPWSFLANRLLFFFVAILLVWLAVFVVKYTRKISV